jgi:hypothetical protein
MIILRYFSLLLLLSLFACHQKQAKKTDGQNPVSFAAVKGIKFIEVRRAFDNGIAFDDQGFQQEPEWIVQFLSDTTVNTYSPTRKKMIHFIVTHSHDAVYNFAKEWFRVLKISKDSLVFQRLQVSAKVVQKDARSNVYMTFYAEDYIRNKLKTTVKELQKPKKQDSLFVKKHAEMANQNPLDSAHFFAARNPVEFIPKSKLIAVKKVSNVDKLQNHSASYDYLYPEYEITIQPAYKEFYYSISAVVDDKGKLVVYRFNAIEEYRENRKKVLQGILDVYVSQLATVKPGKTLGFTHSTLVFLDLVGKK